MVIYTIYKAVNTANGKIYIGFTNNFPRRQQKHKYDAFRSECGQYNSAFYCAIRKYGWHVFEWEIIYQSLDKIHTKDVMEEHFIRECNSHISSGLGYNSTYGGDGTFGYSHTEETKQKLRAQKEGLPVGPFSQEHKERLSSNKKQYWATHKCNLGQRSAKTFKLTTVDGQEIIVHNLRQFMKENNLVSTGIYELRKGTVNRYKQFISCELVDL